MGRLPSSPLTVADVLDHFRIAHSKNRCACPIHKGSNPTSFWFSEFGYYCHSCGARGNPINLISEILRISHVKAIEYARTQIGFEIDSCRASNHSISPKTAKSPEELLVARQKDQLHYKNNLNQLISETLAVLRHLTEIGHSCLNDFHMYEAMLVEIAEELDSERIAVNFTIKSIKKGVKDESDQRQDG